MDESDYDAIDRKLKNSFQFIKKDIAKLEKSVDSLEKEQKQSASREELDKEIVEIARRLRQLEKQLLERPDSTAKLEKNIDALDKELRRFATKQELEAELAGLQKDLKALEKRQPARVDLDSSKKEVQNEINSARDSLQTQIDSLKKELADFKPGKEEVEAEIKAAKDSLQADIISLRKELSKREDLTEEIKLVRKAKAQLEKLEASAAFSKDVQEGFDGLSSSMSKLRQEFSRRKDFQDEIKQIKGINKELDKLQRSIVDRGEFELQLGRLKAELQDGRREFAKLEKRLETDIDDIKAELLSKDDFQARAAEFQERLESIEDSVKSNLKEIEKVRGRIEDAKGVSKERLDSSIKKLDDSIRERATEIKEIDKLLDGFVQRKEFEAEVGHLSSEIERLSREFSEREDLKAEFGKLKELRKRLDELNKLAISKKRFDEELEEIRDKVNNKFLEIEKAKSEIEVVAEQSVARAEFDREIMKLGSDIKELGRDFKGIGKSLVGKKEIGKLEAELGKKVDLKQFDIEIEELNETFKDKAEEIRKLKSDMETLTAGLSPDTAKKYIEKFELSLKELDKKLRSFEDVYAYNEKTDKRLDELKEKVAALAKSAALKDKVDSSLPNVLEEIGKLKERFLAKKEFDVGIDNLNDQLKERRDEIKTLREETSEMAGEFVDSKYFDQQLGKLDHDINDVKDIVSDVQKNYAEKKELEASIGEVAKSVENLDAEFKLVRRHSREDIETKTAIMEEHSRKMEHFEKKIRSAVLANKSLFLELRKINMMLEQDQRLKEYRQKIESKMQEMRDEKVEDIRSTLLYVFVGLLVFGLFLFFYLGKNPYAFPGLKPKLLLGLLILGFVVILLFLPYRKIMPRAEQYWFSFKQWLRLWKSERREPQKKDKDGYVELPVKEEVKIKRTNTEIKPKKLVRPSYQREYIKKAINLIFQISLVAFLLVLLVNEFKPVTFINLNYFLIFVAVFGVLSFSFPAQEKAAKKNYVMIVLIGLAGGFFIYLKTKQLGWLSYIIGVVSCVLIIMLSSIMMEEPEK